MVLKTTLLGKTYTFRDVKEVLAKANEEKFHALGTPINRCEVVCKPFVLPAEEKKKDAEEE